MLLRQLNETEFERFQNHIINKIERNPLDACFHSEITVDNRRYLLKIQSATKRRIAILQALQLTKISDSETRQILITDNKILLALFELLLFQGAA